MGIFNNFFGSKANEEGTGNVYWNDLNSMAQLEGIILKSNEKPQLIFKHSTRCGISNMVLRQFISMYKLTSGYELNLLDLLAHRDISRTIEQRLNVVHQSPQLIVIKDGKVISEASHGEILEIRL